MSKPTVAAYVRVSSKAQSHAMQRHAIEQAAGIRGDAVGRWYEEKRSAKTMDRPALQSLRDDVRAGRIARLYVYRIDRLSRTGIRDTLDVLDEFKRAGCVVVNLADGFSLDGPVADVVIAVMSWSAQMERIAINERIAAARDRMRRDGRPWGRPPSYTAEQAANVRALRDAGNTIRGVAVEVRLSRSVVERILSRKHAEEPSGVPVEVATDPAA